MMRGVLRSAYRAFNARDIDAAIALVHPEVASISSQVEPERFVDDPDGSITVDVHQVVHDANTGDLASDARVQHRYRLEDGLVVRMDVLEPQG